MPTTKDLIVAAKVVAAEKRPYFAPGLHAMLMIEKPGLGTMMCDKYWRMYYDPELLGKYPVNMVAGMITHELCHLLQDHHQRAQEVIDCDAQIMNIAQDLSINDAILEEKIGNDPITPLPDWVVETDSYGKKLTKKLGKPVKFEKNQMAEVYYRQLRDLLPPTPKIYISIGGGEGKEGQDQNGNGNGQGQQYKVGGGSCGSCARGGKDGMEDPAPSGAGDDKHPGVTGGEADMIRRQIAMEINRIAESASGRGTVPEGMRRWAKEYLNPKVNYMQWVKSALRNAYAEAKGKGDYTWRQRSRRQAIFGNFVMPGLTQPKFRAGFIIDTSGSMSDGQMGQAVAEVKGFISQFGHRAELYALSCDAAVHKIQKLESAGQLELYGGGGTSMTAGFEAFEKMRPQVDLIVCVTDLLTDWPEHKPKATTVIVAVGNGQLPSWPCHKVHIPLEN